MYINALKAASIKRLSILRQIMSAENLSAILLFDSDPLAYKISLTQHFNMVIVTLDNIYVIVDPALYHEAIRESPWDVILIENFIPSIIVKKIASLIPREKSELKIGINKKWGLNKIAFLYSDILSALASRSINIIDVTPLLADVFDKPYEEEIPIIKWISDTCSKALEAVEEYLRPGIREYEVAAIIDKVLDENGIVDRWFTTIVASGPRAATPHAKTSNRRIREEDPVVIDIGPF